ncbi:hypothetical protein VitviT2T_019490 [Vitis vinifera]|nr:hypothetical protein CK203_028007 [Vitis vinifera]WKA01197.1 hypothetical protein VitviT2T_019490 [Vitis vinifera]
MEDQCSTPSWVYCQQEEDIEELKHTLLCTTLELETTVLSAQEEIRRREYEVIRINDLLSRTIKERDEAQARCQKLMLEKLIMLQNQQEAAAAAAPPLSAGTCSSDDEQRGGDSYNGFSPSNSDEYISLSPRKEPISQPQANLKLLAEKPLPEKGKLLQAVLEAGPLLQTLLLAGPLPQWQHPPPQLDSIEIPPVAIPSPPTPPLLHPDSCVNVNASFCKKRGQAPYEDSESSPNKKYQRVVHH